MPISSFSTGGMEIWQTTPTARTTVPLPGLPGYFSARVALSSAQIEEFERLLCDNVRSQIDEKKRPLIEPSNSHLSIRRQCELMGLNRSSYYLSPATESEARYPLDVVDRPAVLRGPRSTAAGGRPASLERSGETVNRKRVQRLMALMGLDGIFPKPRTTVAVPDARVYPYLLRDRVLTHVNEVWSSDITYVPMRHGFMYLTAVIDWFSRYVLSWRLSNTLEGQFCLEALDEALSMSRERSSTRSSRVRSSRGITPAAWRRPGSR